MLLKFSRLRVTPISNPYSQQLYVNHLKKKKNYRSKKKKKTYLALCYSLLEKLFPLKVMLCCTFHMLGRG